MANDDPKLDPTDDAAGTGAKGKSRRRPPPTLDLAATDVTPETPAAAEPVADEVPVFDAESPAAPDEPPAPVHPTAIPGAPKAGKPVRHLGLFGGLVVALISGLLGGAVALGLVSTFYSAEQNIDSITELEARALDLRQRVDALESRSGAPVSAPAAGTLAPQELATRLDALEAGLTELGGKVNQSETTSAAPDEATAALGTRLGALEEKVGSLPAPAATATPDEVAALGSRVGALEQRVGAIPAPVPAASPQDVASANARIAALEQRLAEVSARQQTSGQGAAQLIALDALHDAIAQGRPFATELRASRTLLGAGGDTLAALEPVAGEGFAGGPALAARLKAATAPAPEPAASPAAGASTGEQGVLDKLYESAKGLVSIRRSTQASIGAGAEELATAEAALMRGDYAAALAALNALPAAEQAAAAPVVSAIEARHAALATVAGLSQHVLATFAGGAQ
ncbi:COG4223 family protein [Ancylobacter sp. VNQ12]|uniref:COG4223 family protein n=1 Tax=Ancylobacter sp. VNQ12 TaxID=3400920 RepID=UPI003C022600